MAFERATGRILPRPAPRPPPAAGPAPPLLPPAGPGFIVDAAPQPARDLGAALVGRRRQLLYWWPDDGWQRGTVARLCPRPAFSHVVAYTRPRQTSALRLRGTADSSRRHGCLTLHPMAPGGCCCPPPRPRACGTAPILTHDFGFGLCLVTAWTEPDRDGPGLPRAQPFKLPLDSDAESSQSRCLRLFPEYKPRGRKLR
jgi:hypothetical protein